MERSEPLAGVSRRPSAVPDIDPRAGVIRDTEASRPEDQFSYRVLPPGQPGAILGPMTGPGPHATQTADGVKGLRLLLSADGTFFKVARIAWSASDASVYVLPYVPPGGIAYAGVMKIPGPGGTSQTQVHRQFQGDNPKLSFHEHGRNHASVSGGATSPIWGRGLLSDADGHFATVTSFDVRGLPTVEAPRKSGSELDVVLLPSVAESYAVNVALYVCLTEEDAARLGKMWLTLQREGRPRPLYVAIGVRIPDPPTEAAEGGVVAFGGFGPGDDARPQTGVYVATAPQPISEPLATFVRPESKA
jgi:hypothetical protein